MTAANSHHHENIAQYFNLFLYALNCVCPIANNYIQNVSSPGIGGGVADNATDAFAVGQFSVTASVNVAFLIE